MRVVVRPGPVAGSDRSRAAKLLHRLLEDDATMLGVVARELFVPEDTVLKYRDGRALIPIERQLCLALLAIERFPAYRRLGYRLRGQVIAEARYRSSETEVHSQPPEACLLPRRDARSSS